ncbi:isopenicillin N synthase family dioxygenase [Rubrivivax gelatinosus]|uniref:isopenicillin N synthase family dioxygenase n=1 Tax=Rubrivivax gelatinosus TaxID=28068 RepID=UPI000302548F|nr:2OG-Fe(II) oxygenase family protein [Rubrivivax gelatinosus]MBG6080957.1 isopenicillin N synthase-like dioxygenase [Rubrivivax gelatinosus]
MSILLLDLDSAPPAELARRLDEALRADGFVAVTGHGVPEAVIAAAFDASRRFFALAEADKRRWHIDHWPLQRGFDPVGWQALDPNRPADLKESFYLGVEALGPNQWPDEALVPGFRAALDAYSAALRTLAARMMGLFELALALPAGHFDAYTRQPTCVTRLLHYPPAPAVVLPGQIGCGAHTDWGALTLLAQDDAGGLQVQRADGRWLDVEPVAGAFVVNIGDMTRRWTNDRWRSTMHRVVPRRVGIERWSIAYFFDLDVDAVVSPLPSCVDAAHPPRYAPITAGEHLAEMYRRTTVG